MGDVVPFKARRRWTRPEDYGHEPEPPDNGPKGPKSGWHPKFRAWQFWLVAFLGVSVWVGSDPVLVEPPAFLSSKPEKVEGTFTRCGKGRGTFCVVDGDTFKLGDRSVRLIGIDAPEIHPARCPAEAEAGERATAELQRLLNQGPFTMVGRIDQPRDKYGRDLRAATRDRSDGTTQNIAADMIASGTVRAYMGEFRSSWCPAEEG